MNDIKNINNLIGIDTTIGLKNFLGDQELFHKVLLNFYEDHINDADNIKNCLESNEINKAKRLVHTIKGAASTLGAIKLNRIAVKFEADLIKDKSKDTYFHEFQFLLNEVLSGISNLDKSDNKKDATIQDQNKFNKAELSPIIQELSEKLNQASPKAIELVTQLSHALGKVHVEAIEELQETVDAFDFENALTTLEKIKKSIV